MASAAMAARSACSDANHAQLIDETMGYLSNPSGVLLYQSTQSALSGVRLQRALQAVLKGTHSRVLKGVEWSTRAAGPPGRPQGYSLKGYWRALSGIRLQRALQAVLGKVGEEAQRTALHRRNVLFTLCCPTAVRWLLQPPMLHVASPMLHVATAHVARCGL